MKLPTHLQLQPRLRMREAAPPLPPHAFMACAGTTLPFIFTLYQKLQLLSRNLVVKSDNPFCPIYRNIAFSRQILLWTPSTKKNKNLLIQSHFIACLKMSRSYRLQLTTACALSSNYIQTKLTVVQLLLRRCFISHSG